jgi:hypothetical protein
MQDRLTALIRCLATAFVPLSAVNSLKATIYYFNPPVDFFDLDNTKRSDSFLACALVKRRRP